MFRRLWYVLNKYEAELVVSSSWRMKEMRTVSMETEISHGETKQTDKISQKIIFNVILISLWLFIVIKKM